MTNQKLKLAQCPYCPNGNGEILFNVAQMHDLFAWGNESLYLKLQEEPTQSLIIFNGERADSDHCPHLLGILGDCGIDADQAGQGQRGRELSLEWWHEAMQQRGVSDFVFFDVLNDEAGHASGDIPAYEEEFCRQWSASDTSPGTLWHIQGSAYFAADIEMIATRASKWIAA